jgi:hypothetical protein
MVQIGNRAAKVFLGILFVSLTSIQGFLIYRVKIGNPVGKN